MMLKTSKSQPLVLPSKVSNVGKKIRNLFFLQDPGPRSIEDVVYFVEPEKMKNEVSNGRDNEYEYRKNLQAEVE